MPSSSQDEELFSSVLEAQDSVAASEDWDSDEDDGTEDYDNYYGEEDVDATAPGKGFSLTCI